MRTFRFLFFLGGLGLSTAVHAQQPVSPATPVATPVVLSEDSVRVMSKLISTSVQQLRGIYLEPNDGKAVQLIESALRDIPGYNQRLRTYTTSLPREQQLQLAHRLRQQPWQIELQTLLRSPEYKGFAARSAKNPALQAAANRLQAAGFIGTSRPTPSTTTASAAAPKPAVAPAASAPVAAAPAATPATKPSAAPAKAAGPTVPAGKGPTPAPVTPSKATTSVAATAKASTAAPKAEAAAAARHTVQKGESLYSIARKYQVTIAQLQEWNAKTTDQVQLGEVLVVQAAAAK